ncbi:hypothetical protein TanjilG_17996 [Lupinus angustifolius]|uniref:NAB domain-containing protein n=1 Tax=Lupinus angustifolius TaxID=3871 RepID=A0A1J7FX29_LUPAN|nr:PREDICTED: myosin-8-like [Lupinus angustifolius]OIV92645.1 hypothetical protein TanjilG_17996 [Lupinus angustifolius]
MMKHHFREFTKSFESQIDPEKSEELKRTKTDIENNLTRVLKLIQNEEQSKRDGNLKETELVGLIEDFYNQYQSLYVLCGRLTGEYVKVIPRVERLSSASSSSSSESDYFSSEEVVIDTVKQELKLVNNNTTEVNDLNHKLFSTEREHSSNLANNTNEVVKTQAPLNNKANELEDRLISRMQEVESLNRQKRNLELQVESQAYEVKQLGAENTELELLLKETKRAVSVLKGKLKSNEDKAISKNVELMAQISKLELEAKSLRNQKGKMEEKLKRNRNEALTQKKDLTEKLDSVCKHNKELEAQLEREREQVSQCLVQMEKLKEKLDEMTSIEHGLIKEKDFFLSRINDLELEMETRCSNQHDLEEQVRSAIHEISQLVDERKALQDGKYELERAITQKKEEISAILSKHESDKNEAFKHAMALTEEVEIMKVELDTLQEQKSMLELQNEQRKNEYSESLAKMETRCSNQHDLEEKVRSVIHEISQLVVERKALQDEKYELERAMTQKREEISATLSKHESDKNETSMYTMALTEEVESMRIELNTLQEQKSMLELQNKQRQHEYSESLAKMENLIAELETKEETIKKLTGTIEQISVENKEAKIWSKMNQRLIERKIEELAEKFKRKMEDNIRLLHQRIHIAEQLNIENKDSCKKTKQRYEQENKTFQEKIAFYENELRTIKVSDQGELDSAARKVEEHIDYVLTLVSKMLCEVQFAKDWIKKKNGEMKQLKDKVDRLTALLNDKEAKELLLREKLWELEASVSKEGGEKLNLVKAVNQLEKKVRKLEKNLKQRDEELVGLGEKKREAIRQLCILAEFHRESYNHLKGQITKTKINNRT